MKWFTTLMVFALALAIGSQVEAGHRKSKCRSSCRVQYRSNCSSGSYSMRSSYSSSSHSTGSMDGWAMNEAIRMSERGTNGHTQGAPPGYFVGVGCNGMTCQGSGTLVGEAHFQGKSVRVWKR